MAFPLTLDQTDPYGTDLAFDDTGDLVVWANGALGTIGDADNCVQALKLWMRTDEGELPLAPSFGSAFPSMVGMKLDAEVGLARAQGELQRIMGGDRRFLNASNVQAIEQPGSKLVLRAVLVLVGGEQLLASDVQDPTAVDLIDPDDLDASDLDSLAELAPLDFFQDPIETDALTTIADDLIELANQVDNTGDAAAITDLADQLDNLEAGAAIQELAEDLDPSTTATDIDE